ATAPTVVVYEPNGRHRAAWESGPSAHLSVLDPGLLASAPDRLLTSGIVDAWAKIHEVRLTCGDAAERSAGARAAIALLDDLAELLDRRAQDAIDAGPSGSRDEAKLATRRLVAEAVVTHPGLIGGLAGREAKLAVAHPIHDALTAHPDAFRALHGEKVGFGNLVQLMLSDGPERAKSEAERYARLGLACHLAALGCEDACSKEGMRDLARDALTDPAVTTAVPGVALTELAAAIAEADAIGRAVAPTPTGG
ncbi:MAG: iron-containing alcohol dehydrogenase, partial [Trueperaceae bacterium]